jgi:TPR repeat protein
MAAEKRGFAALLNRGMTALKESLGGAYFFGFGVPQNYIEAHKWPNLAVSTM